MLGSSWSCSVVTDSLLQDRAHCGPRSSAIRMIPELRGGHHLSDLELSPAPQLLCSLPGLWAQTSPSWRPCQKQAGTGTWDTEVVPRCGLPLPRPSGGQGLPHCFQSVFFSSSALSLMDSSLRPHCGPPGALESRMYAVEQMALPLPPHLLVEVVPRGPHLWWVTRGS